MLLIKSQKLYINEICTEYTLVIRRIFYTSSRVIIKREIHITQGKFLTNFPVHSFNTATIAVIAHVILKKII